MTLLPFDDSKLIEAGCDEAGRGCLAGPVFAAAVILPKDFDNDILNDSKLLSLKKRELLRELIEKEALSWGIAMADNLEIDVHNIANASYIAMNRAVEKLSQKPEILLIDGKYFKTQGKIPYKCIIKGDSKYASIAAASILAKTYRDDYMHALTPQYPEYDWGINKGYPTVKHRKAIFSFGITPHHRMTFRLLPENF
jgi:ribonuclease HII